MSSGKISILASQQVSTELPEHLRNCIPPEYIIPKGPWNLVQTVRVIAELKRAERINANCAQQLLAWAESRQ